MRFGSLTVLILSLLGLTAMDLTGQMSSLPSGDEGTTPVSTGVLTLEKAIDLTLKKNLQVQAARSGAHAARLGVKNAYAQFLPSVGAGLGFVRIDDGTLERANAFYDLVNDPASPFSDPQNPLYMPEDFRQNVRPGAWKNSFVPSLSVTQPIFTGGALRANLIVARAEDLSARASLDDSEQEAVYNTLKAYFEVLKARDLVSVAQENLRTAEEHLASARRQVQIGLRSRTDVLRWEVQKANAESYLARAENALAVARPSLNQVIGLELDEEYGVAPAEDVAPDIPATLEEREAVALRHHPGVRVMEARVEQAQGEISAAHANFMPIVSLAYNYT